MGTNSIRTNDDDDDEYGGDDASSIASSNFTSSSSSISTNGAIVAVAVKGNSKSSKRAVRWAINNLMLHCYQFLLVYVMPSITFIPTPSGKRIPIDEVDANLVETYRKDMKSKCEEFFLPYKTMSKTRKMDTLVLEDDNPAYALLRHISESGCNNLVLGSSSNYFTRKLKSQGVPSTLMQFVTKTCNIYVVSRNKLITKLSDSSSIAETSARHSMQTISEDTECSSTSGEQTYGFHSRTVSEVDSISEASSDMSSQGWPNGYSYASSSVGFHQGRNHQRIQNFSSKELESPLARNFDFMASYKDANQVQTKLQAELEGLQLELRTTLDMYSRACEDLIHVQKKVQALSSECAKEARELRAAMEREELWRQTAVEENLKHLVTVKELETAKEMLAKEVYERQRAELSIVANSSERQELIDALLLGDKRYKRYSRDEIEAATDFFSEAKKIGEGGYGKVYKCSLGHTPVAVKVLQPDESDKTKKEEFLMEVEILSQLRHPNLVLLLGACPDIGCLVYEYMENGNLDERLFCEEGTPPLPWFIRFRIAYESTETLVLQLLTGRHPNGLFAAVENSIKSGSFHDVLDKSISDWPLAEAEELACIALRCCKLRCRDRPDLESSVLPVLEKLSNLATIQLKKGNINTPSYFFCPILQEIMEDPYIAADGFTYEYTAIRACLEKQQVSPVTRLMLQHSRLTPNRTLRSAIQEWGLHNSIY
ncbi:hypothetical protein MKW98_014529 [Papaver atlanticum]|uniref:RING-type E3 ubiquitin transferase n=1 Tax=Papaver atlanticum TaxID=357466 RepID=A0AAD4SJF4_9MAGN|nr:hypothetical protein MKW98_014529 [Papaver atlanticum]